MATTRSSAGAPAGAAAVGEKLYSIVRDERFAMAVGTVLAVIASIPIMSNHVLVPHYILQPYQKNIKYPLYYDNLSHEDTYLLTAGVVVPMALDCVADVFSALSTAVAPRPAFLDHEQSKDSKATRLNLLERIVFVLGVTIPVLVVFTFNSPATSNDDAVVLYNFVRASCSFYTGYLLCLVPVACFLQRCTTTWTPLRTLLVVLTAGLGAVCKNFRYVVAQVDKTPGSPWSNTYASGNVFFQISYCLQILFTLMSFASFVREKWVNRLASEPSSRARDAMRTEVEAIDDFYQNYVPAVHQAVLVLSACLEIYYTQNSLVQNYSNTLMQERIVVIGNLVIAALIVFVEGRIKHNDTQRILLRELMSTKKVIITFFFSPSFSFLLPNTYPRSDPRSRT
jgi:hypothetical protein